MSIELRVLFVEDSEDDILLLQRELHQAGFSLHWEQVHTEAAMQQALEFPWDVILADYSMPQFSAPAALAMARQRNLEVPFIVVSGSIGEETAVTLLHAGAQDYVMKDNLSRLVPSIRRGLRELELRRERQQAEEALRESEERWLFALEGSGDSVWDWNIATNRTFYSKRWKEAIGFGETEIGDSPDEWMGRIHPEDLESATYALQSYLQGDASSYHAEYRMRCKDGSYAWFLGRGKVVARDAHGAPTRMVGTASDITLRKRAEEERQLLEQQLRQSQKMEALGTLAGGIAHDFNNILTAIMGYTSLLELDSIEQPDSYEMVLEIARASQRARNLVQQILAFSRPHERQLIPTRLELVIEEALKLLRAALPASTSLETIIDARTQPILADASQIHQAILNLVTNAAYALDGQNGTVQITLSPFDIDLSSAALHPDLSPGPYVRLSVSDTGRGMDPATLERIFEPFFTTRMPGQGTGLGLAVVHGVVKSHRGAVTVASEPGTGSVFNLFFPALADAAAEQVVLPVATPHGHGERILYVDDEVAICRMVAKMLERLGYHVTIRTDSAQALATFRLRTNEFQLAIIDLTMPGLSGIELVRQLRLLDPHVPIILTSGFSTAGTEEQLRALRVGRVLMKPFTTNEIGQLVADVFQE